MKKLLLSLLGALIALPTLAFRYTYAGKTLEYYEDEETSTCTVKAYYPAEPTGDIIIPSYAVRTDHDSDGHPRQKSFRVTKISGYAFSGYDKMTSVNIPNTVTEIGVAAFHKCVSLKSVVIPASVTRIEHSAFSSCSGLTSISLPNSLTEIDIDTFNECVSLKSVVIPTSVTIIRSFAFGLCSGLTSIVIPTSVTEIEEYAFSQCSSLPTLEIPGSIKVIKSNTFEECRSLTSITIPNSVVEIGSFAFDSCSGLKTVVIPTSVKKIDSSAFRGCTSLHSIRIPKSITEIMNNVFEGCTGLKLVDIPTSVTKICDRAFLNCNGLTSITIPTSVISIGEKVFFGCTGLTSVTYLAEEPEWFDPNIFDYKNYPKATLNYLKSAEAKIAMAIPWNMFVNRIGRDADWKDDSSIDEVRTAESDATTVYDMRGMKVGNSTEGLPRGLYIIREGSKTRKFAI